jgi:glycosyltransferase involved in cell wall biosynthesis
MKPIVSVVIPTYNRLNVLKRTLECVEHQTIGRSEYQIIVVDDSSKDGTGDYLAKLSGIDWHINEFNKGRAVTRNLGIKLSKAELIIFIDDDIWVDNNLLMKHVERHKENINVVVGAIKPSPEVNNTIVNAYMNRHHEWCCREMLLSKEALPYTFLKTANVSVPKTVFKEVGLFNEKFYHYGGEDTELGYRLHKHGVQIIYEPKAVGYHYHNETIDSIVEREVARTKSLRILKELITIEKDDTSYDGFFTAKYHVITNIKTFLYNIVKYLLFLKYSKNINKLIIKTMIKLNLFQDMVINILIPILKIQYLYFGQKQNED